MHQFVSRLRRARVVLLLLGVVLGAAACADSVTAPENVPADHTVRQGRAFHRSGLSNPTVNCTSCHGADLRGGTNGEPSCFSCHGRKW